MGLLYDLAFNLRTEDSELKQGLQKAKNNIKGFEVTSKNSTKKIALGFKTMGSQVLGTVGGMTGHLGMMASALSNMIPKIGGVNSVLKIMKVALASTGIGLIVVALGSLLSYFQGTKKGADVFNKALGGIKAVIDNLQQRLHLLGEAVSLLLQGKFKEAAAAAKQAFGKMDNTVKESYEKGKDLAERENKLKKEQIAFIVKEAELKNEIARLTDISSDKLKTQKEREEATRDAIKLQTQLSKEKIRLQTEEADILVKKNALGDNTYEDDRREAELRAQILMTKKEEYDKIRELKNRIEEILGITGKQEKKEDNINEIIEHQNEQRQNSIDLLEQYYEKQKQKEEERKALQATDWFENNDFDLPEEDFSETSDPEMEKWAQRKIAIDQYINSLMGFHQQSGSIESFLSSAHQGFSQLGGALGQGAESFKQFAEKAKSSIKGVIGGLVAQGVATMISNALQMAKGPLLFLAPVIAGIGAGLAKTAFNSLIPDFATGGIFSGEQIIRVGEYSTAKTDPEVVGKLSDLNKYFTPSNTAHWETANLRLGLDYIEVGMVKQMHKNQATFGV